MLHMKSFVKPFNNHYTAVGLNTCKHIEKPSKHFNSYTKIIISISQNKAKSKIKQSHS